MFPFSLVSAGVEMSLMSCFEIAFLAFGFIRGLTLTHWPCRQKRLGIKGISNDRFPAAVFDLFLEEVAISKRQP